MQGIEGNSIHGEAYIPDKRKQDFSANNPQDGITPQDDDTVKTLHKSLGIWLQKEFTVLHEKDTKQEDALNTLKNYFELIHFITKKSQAAFQKIEDFIKKHVSEEYVPIFKAKLQNIILNIIALIGEKQVDEATTILNAHFSDKELLKAFDLILADEKEMRKILSLWGLTLLITALEEELETRVRDAKRENGDDIKPMQITLLNAKSAVEFYGKILTQDLDTTIGELNEYFHALLTTNQEKMKVMQ